MTNFKTEKRAAKVGEKILVTNVSGWETDRYVTGDIGKVVSTGAGSNVYVKINDSSNALIFGHEYEVIIDEQPKPPKKKKKEIIAELEAKVADLEAELAEIKEMHGLTPAPEVTRAEIIDQAKGDIERLKRENGHYLAKVHGEFIGSCTVEFHVNEAKRTVTALLRGIRTKRIRAKGFAKCAPGDVFNADLGKAIALRRALNIEVPSDYLNVPPLPEGLHEVNGVIYREVKRKAREGELVIMLTGGMYYSAGNILEVLDADSWHNCFPGEAINVRTLSGKSWAAYHYEYNVLEPVK